MELYCFAVQSMMSVSYSSGISSLLSKIFMFALTNINLDKLMFLMKFLLMFLLLLVLLLKTYLCRNLDDQCFFTCVDWCRLMRPIVLSFPAMTCLVFWYFGVWFNRLKSSVIFAQSYYLPGYFIGSKILNKLYCFKSCFAFKVYLSCQSLVIAMIIDSCHVGLKVMWCLIYLMMSGLILFH